MFFPKWEWSNDRKDSDNTGFRAYYWKAGGRHKNRSHTLNFSACYGLFQSCRGLTNMNLTSLSADIFSRNRGLSAL